MNRVQYELDLMARWLKEYGGTYHTAVDFYRTLDLADSELLEFLGLDGKNVTVRQVLNALTKRMISWDGRYVDNDYSWQYMGLVPHEGMGLMKTFRCTKDNPWNEKR